MKSISNYLLVAALLLGIVACKSQISNSDKQNEITEEAVIRTIDVGDEELHYMEQGTGEPLIFIHGTIGDYRAWVPRMAPYSQNYHVVTYSRRYAWPNRQEFDSMVDYSVRIHADDLYAFVRKLGFKKVHLVGHSYGAYTALKMALDHPEIVRSLVLGEPPALSLLNDPNEGRASFNAFRANNLRLVANDFRAKRDESGLEHFIQGVMGPDFRLEQAPPEAKQAWMDNLLELWGYALTDTYVALDPKAIQSLDVPVLLLTGDRSPEWFGAVTRELHSLLPHSELVTINNSSHGLYFENPIEVDTVMKAFLDSID